MTAVILHSDEFSKNIQSTANSIPTAGNVRNVATSKRPVITFLISANQAKEKQGASSIDDFADLLSKEVDGFSDALVRARKNISRTINDGRITLRSLRMNRGLSQSQLAAMIGTSQPHVARLEARPEAMMIGTATKLSKALGVDINTIAALASGAEIESSNV